MPRRPSRTWARDLCDLKPLPIREASSSRTICPTLCRLWAYSAPGFPRPTISQVSVMRGSFAMAGRVRAPGSGRAETTVEASPVVAWAISGGRRRGGPGSRRPSGQRSRRERPARARDAAGGGRQHRADAQGDRRPDRGARRAQPHRRDVPRLRRGSGSQANPDDDGRVGQEARRLSPTDQGGGASRGRWQSLACAKAKSKNSKAGINKFYLNESVLKVNLQAGVVGPESLAEDFQKLIHNLC